MSALTVLFGALSFAAPESSLLSRSSLAVAESFLVALILAVAIDPYLKATGFKDTAREISESFFWESVSPYCPLEYRERIKELARSDLFCTHNLTTIIFEWVGSSSREFLRVSIVRELSLRNTSSNPYRPRQSLWVLASTPGFESRYLSWRLVNEADDFDEQVEGSALEPYLGRRQDGAVVLEEGFLMGHFERPPQVAPDADFRVELRSEMYRRARGYLPIVHGIPNGSGRLRCRGAALGDLSVRCMFAGDQLEEVENSSCITFHQPRIAAQGEGLLLGWKLKDDL
jgi:hypothetical protein